MPWIGLFILNLNEIKRKKIILHRFQRKSFFRRTVNPDEGAILEIRTDKRDVEDF